MNSGTDAPKRAVGVRDVAALAGVSRQTVSRVLNDHPDVASETLERVQKAMAELGYRVNNAARMLGTKKSHTIGILASEAIQYGPARSIAGVEAAAREAGYWVTAAFTEDGDAKGVAAAVDHLIGQGVEGLIVITPHGPGLKALDAHTGDVPIVALNTPEAARLGVAVDQVLGGRLAVAALADAGHERIAHLAGPVDWLEAESRSEGFHEELASRGLEPSLVIEGDWSVKSGYEAAKAIRDSGVTAVFSANDQMAVGLMSGCHELGMELPRELSVVGFDDNPDAAYFWPRLTTIRQDFAELARRAVSTIVSGLPVEDEPHKAVSPELILRGSVAQIR